MQATTIVKHLDVVKQRRTGRCSRTETVAELELQAREEALHRRVVPTVSLPRHADLKAALLEPLLVIAARVLGGFNWSLQHLEMEVFNDGSKQSC